MFFGCYQNKNESKIDTNKEVSAVNSVTANYNSVEKDTLNKFQFLTKKGDTIKVSYLKDTLRITFNNEYARINIPYSAPVESIIPCNCLAIKKKRDFFVYENHYLYRDSILLLPVLDFDGRINLFVINTNNGKTLPVHKPRESYMLNTYLTWFVFNEKNGLIITSNSLDLEGKTILHTFKINKSELAYKKSINKQSNWDIYSDEENMKDYIKRIAK
jgi:hypothetical protein